MDEKLWPRIILQGLPTFSSNLFCSYVNFYRIKFAYDLVIFISGAGSSLFLDYQWLNSFNVLVGSVLC